MSFLRFWVRLRNPEEPSIIFFTIATASELDSLNIDLKSYHRQPCLENNYVQSFVCGNVDI